MIGEKACVSEPNIEAEGCVAWQDHWLRNIR